MSRYPRTYADLAATDDVSALDDLTVGDDAAVTGDLAVTGNTTLTGTLGVTGATTVTSLVASTGVNFTATARTATAAPGGTTGVIADGTSFVTVTVDDANKVITLPTPTPGARVLIANGATGYELRSSAPASVAINGGTGADAESAIAASQLVECRCRTATAWICNQYGTDGTESKVEAAA